MTSKTVSADLLWKVIIWVEWNYAELSPEQKTERPQRAYHPGDGKTISPIITAVRKAYHAAKLEHGKKANFDTCKKAVLEEFTRKNGWSRSTRNFYSSVVATYIGWDARAIPSAAVRTLKQLLQFATYIHGGHYTVSNQTLAKTG